MADKTTKSIKESIIRQFGADYPAEKLYGKVFSLYLLDRYTKLLFRLYEKAKKDK
jgi:hypothetical protein